MSYYPILRAPGCSGQTVLYNFAPNNWEIPKGSKRLLNLTWAEGGKWRSEVIDEVPHDGIKIVTAADVAHRVDDDALPLLSFSIKPLPASVDSLPASPAATHMPAWRATLGLTTDLARTSYQGELDPFPAPGSLLTFAPFIQFGTDVENFMLFLNLEKNPTPRTALVEIFDSAAPDRGKANFEVRNNCVSAIPLDGLGIQPDELPAIICKSMSGIPLYFSRTRDGVFLSLEHTHPPASYVIHGKRWDAQKLLKSIWLDKLGRA